MISNLKNKRKPYVILKSSLGLHFCKSAIGRQNVPRTTTRQRADNPSYIFDCSLHINFFFSFNSFFIHNAYIVQYEDLKYSRKYSDRSKGSICLIVINYMLFSSFGQGGFTKHFEVYCLLCKLFWFLYKLFWSLLLTF